MARKKLVDGKWIEAPSVSGRGKSVRNSTAGQSQGGTMHTVQDAEKEHEIFEVMKNKRLEEQEFTREHFVNDTDEYPMMSELANTWEELCNAILMQHDFLDRKLVAEKLKAAQHELEGEESKADTSRTHLSKKGLEELNRNAPKP